MKKLACLLGLVVVGSVACDVGGTGTATDAVVLDVRCAADAECPSGFECETETEHGVEASYCVSHDEDIVAAGACPAGYELEEEHGGTFCKPHGGSGGSDDTSSSGSGSGASCSADAECAANEECEIETEHGATTGFCKLHSS